jgi:hypothetical protein
MRKRVANLSEDRAPGFENSRLCHLSNNKMFGQFDATFVHCQRFTKISGVHQLAMDSRIVIYWFL